MTTNVWQRVFRATARRRIGSIPHCAALGAADIGEAKLADGRHVWTTWGRNLDLAAELVEVLESTTYDLVVFGTRPDAYAEIVLGMAGDDLDGLMPLLRMQPAEKAWIEESDTAGRVTGDPFRLV